MARKTTGTVSTRSKKTAAPVQPATVEVAPALPKEVRMKGKASNLAPLATSIPGNIEEAIRRRAYELYLERRATAGSESGDENQDWLIAEREIRSRDAGQGQHSA